MASITVTITITGHLLVIVLDGIRLQIVGPIYFFVKSQNVKRKEITFSPGVTFKEFRIFPKFKRILKIVVIL